MGTNMYYKGVQLGEIVCISYIYSSLVIDLPIEQ